MPLLPEYFNRLSELRATKPVALRHIDVNLIREGFRSMHPERLDVKVASAQHVIIDIGTTNLGVRIYKPSDETKLPVVLMFHGGGWVIGDLTTVDCQSREVCVGSNAIVVAVDYRLAPEHRFPTAAEDCYESLVWVHENIASFGGDPHRIAVAGDSAGGNLAAAVALMSRDRNGPKPICQLLVYPVTDGTRFDTSSYLENEVGFGLTRDDMLWFWELYTQGSDRLNPYASVLHAESLSDLPPALILTAEYDVLRDEGEAYGARLRRFGNVAEVVRYDGYIHGFFSDIHEVPNTRQAMVKACSMLKQYLWNS